MQDIEQPASFYLGRVRDVEAGVTSAEPLLYDARDLTTHAVCVGMTGSGKTGLCIGLLEEAALDGVPALVIDPKGDMGNLMLAFPDLAPADFEPWVDPGEAARKGQDVASFAAATAKQWKEGLAAWGQAPERVARLVEAADVAIYTPGSRSGLPLTVLRSFDAPPPELADDPELFGDRIQSAVEGLLGLIGVDADPLQREFVLVSNVLGDAWRAGRDLSIADLIRAIQDPPFERLGVLDLESFYPRKDRFALALQLNNLLASPGFQTWLEGQSLDVDALLWTPEGRPRIAILSIAHLSDAERMFFVTILLNEVVAWMRTQSGTTSLRAILYMDEIFGYFPPTKEPPSKKPMLTLLKQARAYGLGVVLATQNPVDLDYKGLSNTGTWFIGRLQTERDKLRVLDGLEGAMATSGKRFDRAAIDRILSGLGQRVFLVNNVHRDGPLLFQTRWVMSYLRGPLTRDQIKRLMAERVAALDAADAEPATEPGVPGVPGAPGAPAEPAGPPAVAPPLPAHPAVERPILPDGIGERFLAPEEPLRAGERWLLRPALLLISKLHHASTRIGIERWTTLATWAPLAGEGTLDWHACVHVELDDGREPTLAKEPPAALPQAEGAAFAPLPPDAFRKQSYVSWTADLKRWLYRERPLELRQCKPLELVSAPGESERAFEARLAQAARERCEAELTAVRDGFATKLRNQQERVRKAQEKVGKEQEQAGAQTQNTLIAFLLALLGALFGRRLNVGTAARSATRIQKERQDIERAERDLAAEREKLDVLEADLAGELAACEERWQPRNLDLTPVVLRPKKADLAVTQPLLVWLPHRSTNDGAEVPAFDLERPRRPQQSGNG